MHYQRNGMATMILRPMRGIAQPKNEADLLLASPEGLFELARPLR
jgi:hypothetical protein